MSESLGPGSTFAGCRLEAAAGRGGMGVVFRATQLALQRPVALKAIAPELAADAGFRERFQRESHLAASLDHPNVIPVYEAGELDGTLYLIMRWVEGTDLRSMLLTTGRLSPGRAIKLLRPVASALAAAHRRGLVHRDIKPANVLIAQGEQEEDEHVYLTDFGIARRTDAESVTRTGVFVGTVDYTAPERFQGGRGDAASDIYSFGCMLFEALTGHIPYDRPTSVSKIYAHVADPVPSVRAEVPEVPEQLDSIVAKAMAKQPEDRFATAGDLTAALGDALQSLDTGERLAALPKPPREEAATVPPTVTGDPGPTRLVPPEPDLEPGPTRLAPPEPDAEPGPTRLAPPEPDPEPGPTRLVPPEPAPEPPPTRLVPPEPETEPQPTRLVPAAAQTEPTAPGPPTARPKPRRSPWVWATPLIVLSLAGVLIATFSDNPPTVGKSSGSTTKADAGTGTGGPARVQGNGMLLGRTISVPGAPSSVTIGTKNVWVSAPDAGKLVRTDFRTSARSVFPATGGPTVLSAGFKGLWVGQSLSNSLAQFNGASGGQVTSVKLPGKPSAVVFDHKDGTAWVADSSGAITHVNVGGTTIGTPARTSPPATSVSWGDGYVWATNGAAKGLIRVNLDSSGSSSSYEAGQRPVGVAVDRGIWVADANGHVSRFDPRPGQLRVNADVAVAPELDAIAATEPGSYVWAISKSQKKLYRITNAAKPAVTGTAVFSSTPVALAVNANSVWVATQDDKVTEIRF